MENPHSWVEEERENQSLRTQSTRPVMRAIEQIICEWKFKTWDVRFDGKVFWAYHKQCKNGERWVTWDQALKLKEYAREAAKSYRQTQKYKDYRNDYQQTQKFQDRIKERRKTKQHKNYQNSYMKSRRALDPVYDMSLRLRARISKAISNQGYTKRSKTNEIIGCDWNRFVTYLESKFNDGMNWGNRDKWHIDHIIPLATAKSEEEIIKLSHYTNLQPLWASDNLKKGCKINML